MSATPPSTFAEFWPEYVEAHSNPGNRLLHAIGTSLGTVSLALGLATRRPSLCVLAPISGYGFAWIGHFFLQHNRPATFKHPLWSFAGDYKMFGLMLTGRMTDELVRLQQRTLQE